MRIRAISRGGNLATAARRAKIPVAVTYALSECIEPGDIRGAEHGTGPTGATGNRAGGFMNPDIEREFADLGFEISDSRSEIRDW